MHPGAVPAAGLGVQHVLGFTAFQAHPARQQPADRLRGTGLVEESPDLRQLRRFALLRRAGFRKRFRRRGFQLARPKFAEQTRAAELVTAVDPAVDGEEVADGVGMLFEQPAERLLVTG